MKLGDLALNEKRIREHINTLENLSLDEKNKIMIKLTAITFLTDIGMEMFDSDTISNADLSRNERALLLLEIIAGAAGEMVLRLIYKTGDMETTIKGFKHFFELYMKQILEK